MYEVKGWQSPEKKCFVNSGKDNNFDGQNVEDAEKVTTESHYSTNGEKDCSVNLEDAHVQNITKSWLMIIPTYKS